MQSDFDNRRLHWAGRRVFVTPAIGCPARCRFCYLPSLASDFPVTPTEPIDELLRSLTNDDRFERGAAGTLISIGCYSESLAPHSCDSTLELLSLLSALENPIQVATRWSLEDKAFKQFACVAERAGVTIFHSFTSMRSQRDIEIGTPALERRLAFIRACAEWSIPAVLYIKPFLPGITVNSKREFVELCAGYGIKDAVVGPLYVDDRIANRLASILPEPLSSGYYGLTRVPVDIPVEEFGQLHPEVVEIVAAFREADIRVYHHGTELFH